MSMLSRRAANVLAAALATIIAASCTTTPRPTATPIASPSPSATSGIVDCLPAPVPPPGPLPWWADRVFYELFVRSFADSNGDGIGDLRGATARLDVLNDGDPATGDDLGVTGLWLMPVAEATSYHGYDVVDYTAIERDYGTAEDLRDFVTAAHERGIAVIVDLVINHTGREHPWFVDALAGGEREDWYVWADQDPGWPGAAGGDPWHPAGGRVYYGVFWEGMPDLDLRNPEVTAELRDIASVWLHDYGVDGFRLDAAKHLIEDGPDGQVNTPETHAWLAGFREAARLVRPDALVLGEVWEPRPITTGYVDDGSLDAAFDFGVGPTIASAVRLGDAASLTATLAEIAERYPAGGAATFLSNHDQPRIMTTLRGDVAAAKLAAAALLTAPGVPFVYYGEELGLEGTKPDERIRTPYPWTAAEPGHGFTSGLPWEPFADGAGTANLELETADPASLLSEYRRLIAARAALPALRTGSYLRVSASEPTVAAALRRQDEQTLLVVTNLADAPLRDVALDLGSGPLCGRPSATILFSTAPGRPYAAPEPTITPGGGLAGYVPLAELPARVTIVIDLSP